MKQVQELCKKYGTLFVLDEVQTGMFRTGPFLAAHYFDVQPDMVLLAKAMSGGLVPCGAVLMTNRIYRSVYSSPQKAFSHTSTFGENSLAMRAALATLDVLQSEQLGSKATEIGESLRSRLCSRLSKYEMFKEIHGLGLSAGSSSRGQAGLPYGYRMRHSGLSIPHSSGKWSLCDFSGGIVFLRKYVGTTSWCLQSRRRW